MAHEYTGLPVNMTEVTSVMHGATGDHQSVHQEKAGQCLGWLRDNLITVLILSGIVLGFGLGLALREFNPSEDAVLWIGMPGDLYMRLLKMTILPLIACSVIIGASTVDPTMSGKIGGIVIVLVIVTHVMACSLATGITLWIQPGGQSKTTTPTRQLEKAMKTHDVFADLLRNLMPDNIIEASFRQSVTKYILDEDDSGNNPPTPTTIPPQINLTTTTTTTTTITNSSNSNNYNNSQNGTANRTREVTGLYKTDRQEYTRVIAHSDGINVLGLITISAVFGIAAGTVKHDVPVFLSLIQNILQLVLIVVRWFFWLTPIGVLSLIAQSVCQVADLQETFSDLGLFIAAVLTSICVHWVLVLPCLYLLTVRRNPIPFFLSQFSAISIAFAATSTSVAMPEMLNVCEAKCQMDKRVTRIGIPVSVTLNADGSAIFIVVAALFISDYSGVDNTPGNVLVTLVLTIVSSMAIPGVPSSSIFTIVIILTALQVPLQHVAILFAVEWLLDRVRTGLNAASHMTIVACTNALCQNSLREIDNQSRDALEDDLQVDMATDTVHNTNL